MTNNKKVFYKSRVFIASLFFLAWLFSHVDKLAMTIALSFVGEDLNLDPAYLGIIMSAFFAGYALVQIPAGKLTDKFGSKKVATFSIFIYGLFCILTGFAWALIPLLIMRFLFGLGEGGLSPASFRWIAENFKKEERARANGIIFSTNGIGLLVAPLVIAPMIHYFGWRMMFVIIGAIAVIISVLFLLFVRSPEKVENVESKEKAKKIPYKEIIKNPAALYVAIAWFGVCMINWGFLTWFPTYLLKVQGLSLLKTGVIASLPGVAGVLAILVGGWVLDKYFVNREMYVGIGAVVIAGICLLSMTSAPSLPVIVGLQILLMFCLKICFIVVWTIPSKTFSEEVVGSATGFINFIGQGASFIAPVLMGFVISFFKGSYEAGFIVLSFAAIITLVGFLGVKFGKKPVLLEETASIGKTGTN